MYPYLEGLHNRWDEQISQISCAIRTTIHDPIMGLNSLIFNSNLSSRFILSLLTQQHTNFFTQLSTASVLEPHNQ